VHYAIELSAAVAQSLRLLKNKWGSSAWFNLAINLICICPFERRTLKCAMQKVMPFIKNNAMFSFGKKKESIKITDVVFMHASAKWHACLLALQSNTDTVFIVWFEETQQQLQAYFKEQNVTTAEVILYRQAAAHYINNRQLIFAEHYPLHEKETSLYISLALETIKVFSSLDEALFQYFGGEKIIELMKKMGLQENEPVQHAMISMALKNAQEKIAKKVLIEQSAQSQAGWFKRNLNS